MVLFWLARSIVIPSSLRPMVVALLGLSFSLSVCVPVSAQIDNGLRGPQPLDAGALILSDNMLRLNLSGVGSRGASRSSARRTPNTRRNTHTIRRGSAFTTTYQANPRVTGMVKSQYLSWVRQRSPKEAVALQRVFAQHDPISLWRSLVADYGLHSGDSADALSAYWLLNHLIAKQGTALRRQQALAVRAQAHFALVSNAAFGRLSSARRQEVSELWMVNFVVQQGPTAQR
ncbi:hypothetical protein EON80_17765 [bacterium]|nr:MAG: hypothetical protein EON80_17765 [bacterium]